MNNNVDCRPLVSILMPSFNHAKYIEEAIVSVMSQDYENIQLVVIDDGSTDESVSLLGNLREKYDFELILNKENIGIQRNLIEGFKYVRGDYINLIASDEVILKNKISTQLSYLLENGLDGVLGSHFFLYADMRHQEADMEEVKKLFERGEMLNSLYVSDTVGPLTQSGLFKTKIFFDLMHYRKKYKSEDWVILIKMLEEFKVGFLDKPFMYYRITDENAHKKYWNTFPMRLEVISCVTPESMRYVGISNLCESMSSYLLCDNKRFEATKFLVVSFVFDPTIKRFASIIKRIVGFFYNRISKVLPF